MHARQLFFVLLIALSCSAPTSIDQDYISHVAALRKRLPEGFTIIVQKPFVVIGDESPEMVQSRATETVGWAVKRLKAAYFSRDPDEIIDIYLFKDRESYEHHARALLGHEPTTPFGYYSPSDNTMVMNIATGGGTLVHEIVHPFMRSNFPDCPAWFNEGLGSLYEQCQDKDGEIHGLTNWRLAGLQRAILKNSLPSFRELLEMGDTRFYREETGTNYAQARYLCYYLQQQGLLKEFYQQFVENVEADPSGYETLKHILNEDDMEAFQNKWQRFVLELRFP